MIQWFVDKNSKMPLYLQLKDQIEYYISTGAIRADHQLPPVTVLANDLGINFETVRKAYKELEREGMISMKRGQGSFITLNNTSSTPTNAAVALQNKPNGDDELMAATKNLIRRYLKSGLGTAEAKRRIVQACNEVAEETRPTAVIFTECNQLQIREISQLLSQYLNLNVKPVLVQDLKDELRALSPEAYQDLTIISTGFHINEVRSTVGNLPIHVEALIMNMSQETRRQLNALSKHAKIGFICRDQESALLYKDILKAELDNNDLDLTCCTLTETSKVKDMVSSVNALLASPPVYEEIKRLVPKHVPIFNVFDRVDPMSLKIVKDRILASNGHGK